MCGHVGVAGNLEFRDEGLLKRLLVYDYFRGPDSTGIAAIRKTGDSHIVKVPSNPIDLFDSKRFTTAVSGYSSLAFIGHNRAATKGKVNGANAHPFEYGDIVGAHNGTLDAESWKRLNNALGYETDVDSQAIIACIDKIGIEATVGLMEEGKSSVDGAWALVWVDTAKKTLNFLRNKHRPMWFAYTEDYKKIIWASEWPMIRAATSLALPAHEYKLFKTKEGHCFWEMEKDWLYTFDLEKLAEGGDVRPKPRVKVIKGREPVAAYSYAHSPFQQQPPRGKTTNGSTCGANTDKVQELVPIPCDDNCPLGNYMTEAEFLNYSRYGCAWCSANVSYYDKGLAIYEDKGLIVCPECADTNGITRIYASKDEVVSYAEKLKKKLNNSTALAVVAA